MEKKRFIAIPDKFKQIGQLRSNINPEEGAGIAETVLTVERVPIMMAEMGHTELMISRIITEETEPITAHIITEETELIMELTTGAPVRTSRMII